MAWFCSRCGEAHGDGQPCPYMNTIEDNPEGLKVEKLERRIHNLEQSMEKFTDFFKALRNLG